MRGEPNPSPNGIQLTTHDEPNPTLNWIQEIKRDEWHIYVGIMLIIFFVTRSIGMVILQSKAVAFY